MTDGPDVKPETLAAHGGRAPDAERGDVAPPLRPSTNFARDKTYRQIGGQGGYSRDESPSYPDIESLLARLEGGESAMVFASGMAAATAVWLSLAPGDHVVLPKVVYWGLRDWLLKFAANWGLGVDLFDQGDPGALAKALKPGATKLVWIETPCNPTWDVIDIAAAAESAHGAGARLAVDSTVATPVLTQPIALGADLVFHSGTKYLNGTATSWPAFWSPRAPTTFGSGCATSATAAAACSAPSRPGCCSAACAPSTCGSGARAIARSPSRATSRAIPSWPPCSIPAWRATPATRSPSARWPAASAAC